MGRGSISGICNLPLQQQHVFGPTGNNIDFDAIIAASRFQSQCPLDCALSSYMLPLQPPSPFLHKQTEKLFPSLTQQCAPAVWQRTCFAANFAVAASICTSSKQCHLTQPGCRLPSTQ